MSAKITKWTVPPLAFGYEITHEEHSSIPHANAISRLNQDDDESKLVEYSSPNLDELRVHFAEH